MEQPIITSNIQKTDDSCTKYMDHKNCGVARTLKIIGSKWTMLILHNLFEGPKRFGQLQRILNPISSKTLSQRLQELEKSGIIKRKIFAEVPLHVEYSLTNKGHSLQDIFDKMAQWGQSAPSV
jgi:DNA-binding HxlR family transcriptional regulator